MTDRVRMLREQSLAAIPVLAHERALLVTEAAMNTGDIPAPLRRAGVFRYLMERETVVINDGELIVGERGPAPKATSTYPELCCHTLDDLEILDTRQKIAFRVSPETKDAYRERVIPFWKGKTMRERIFSVMAVCERAPRSPLGRRVGPGVARAFTGSSCRGETGRA